MNRVTIYQVDAFSSELFSGNPAAVCPLKNWLSDELMQSIAKENNLSETAFFIPNGDKYDLRWFTPKTEIELIYAGSERSELASDSAKLMQFIAAVFDVFLRSRPWFCPRKPRACQPVAGVAGCSVASGDLCCRFQAPLCSMMSPLCLAGPLPLRISLHQLLLLLSACVAFLQWALLSLLSCGTKRRDHGTKVQQNNKQ